MKPALFLGLTLARTLLFLTAMSSVRADDLPQRIDRLVLQDYQASEAETAPLSSDAVFFRRIHFDLTGTLPTLEQTRSFFSSDSSNKRGELIETLLRSQAHVDYWTLKWGDLLRVKSEYPINLWPNGVQAYHRFIRHSIESNLPYDQFARELLTSSGSNYRVPAVNFFRAAQDQTEQSMASAVALTFLGARTESWTTDEKENLAAFFSKVGFKRTAEWKEEIVFFDNQSTQPVDTRFPNGTPIHITANTDPRHVFADWLISPDNPLFARVAVNRIWYWMMGTGIVSPADDFGPHNLAQNEELLQALAEAFILSGYDQRFLIQAIANSTTYQRQLARKTTLAYAEYTLRPIEAEVLVDALNQLTNSSETYSSPIPEPFTFIPEGTRSIALADGSISSQFLETFGRPSRDTGRFDERNPIPNDAQRLTLLNSSQFYKRLNTSPLFRQISRSIGKNPRQVVRKTYLSILNRYPSKQELDTALSYLQKSERKQQRQTCLDLAWALLNSKEFLYKH